MVIRLVPDDELRRRQRAITALHDEWTARQLAAGVDGPTPEDRPDPSDYNQHVPILEAPAAAQDEYWQRMDEILGGGS